MGDNFKLINEMKNFILNTINNSPISSYDLRMKVIWMFLGNSHFFNENFNHIMNDMINDGIISFDLNKDGTKKYFSIRG